MWLLWKMGKYIFFPRKFKTHLSGKGNNFKNIEIMLDITKNVGIICSRPFQCGYISSTTMSKCFLEIVYE